MLLTLDSSVIVAALRSQEIFHEECRRLLEQLYAGQHIAVQPLTVLVEVVAAVRRRTGSERLALRVQLGLRALPSLRFVELDAQRADAAARLASESGVRGMDAIVVQIAREFSSALVSLDNELVERVNGLVAIQPVTRF